MIKKKSTKSSKTKKYSKKKDKKFIFKKKYDSSKTKKATAKKSSIRVAKKPAKRFAKKAAKKASVSYTRPRSSPLSNKSVRAVIKKVKKYVTPKNVYFQKELFSFLNSSNKKDILTIFEMIFLEKIAMQDLVSRDEEEIRSYLAEEYGKLTLEEKLVLKQEAKKIIKKFNNSPNDICKKIGLCDLIEIINGYKKFKEDLFLKKIKSNSKAVKNAINLLIERCEEAAGITLSPFPIEFSIIIFFVKLSMDTLEEFCECDLSI